MVDRTSRLSAVVASPRPPLRTSTVPIRSAPVQPLEIPTGFSGRIKAGFDCLFAGLMLIPALPIMLACMGIVRLTSSGPAIYTQSRVGRGGKIFTLYKIRTMTHDCESLTGPRGSIPGDPRVTPVGRILRHLHMDELPQLFNVLRGHMSIVGPRPERPEIVNLTATCIKA